MESKKPQIVNRTFRQILSRCFLYYDGYMYSYNYTDNGHSLLAEQGPPCKVSTVLYSMHCNLMVPAAALTLACAFGLKAIIVFYAFYVPATVLVLAFTLLYSSRTGKTFSVCLSKLAKLKSMPFWLVAISVCLYSLSMGVLWH